MSLFGIGAPAVAGIASDILGGIFGASSAEDAAEQQFEYQKELAKIQNDYNVYNYSHRHTWEVADLRRAGLNPILSANSAGSVAAAGQAQAPAVQSQKYDISRAINAIANTALVKKQTDLAQYQSETERIKADADMLRARQEEARTESAISLNQSQSTLNLKNVEMLDKNYVLQKAYMEANVREIDQRIINSVLEVNAKVDYLQKSGEAALMTASAHQASAAAAMRSAAAQEIIAQVAAENGISQRQLNDALEGKASAETKEAYERTRKILQDMEVKGWQLQKDKAHNPAVSDPNNISAANLLFGFGEIIRNGFNPSDLK